MKIEKKIKDFMAFNEEFKAGGLNKFEIEEMLLDFGYLLSNYIAKLGKSNASP